MGIASTYQSLDNELTHESFSGYALTLVGGYRLYRYIAIEYRYTHSILDLKYSSGNTTNQDDNSYDATFTNSAIYLKPNYCYNIYCAYLLVGYGEVSLDDVRGSRRSEVGAQWGAGASVGFMDSWSLFIDYIDLYRSKGFDGRAKNANVNAKVVNIGANYAF